MPDFRDGSVLRTRSSRTLGGSAGDFGGMNVPFINNGLVDASDAGNEALVGRAGRGQDPRNFSQTTGTTPIRSQSGYGDRRIRLRPLTPQANDIIFGSGGSAGDFASDEFRNAQENILAPLHPKTGKTNGLIFPYTPSITYNYIAEWSPQPLVHTNYEVHSYSRSYPTDITISGLFTAQTDEEARYALAAIHFFRTVTKMYFGKTGSSGTSPGTPPPVLLFSGYGEMFNDIPVVVKSFIHELLPDTDYVPVTFQKGKIAWVPVSFNIIVTLGVQLNLRKTREEFDLDKFRTGKLITEKGWL